MAENETKKAILWIGEAVEQGANLRILTEEILRVLRENLLAKYGVEQEEVESEEVIKELSEKDLKNLIELFSKAAFDLKNAVIPQLPLEMAVIEWGMNNEQRTMGSNNNSNGDEKKEKSPPVHSSKFNIQLEGVLSKWPQVLEKVKPLNHSVQAFLKASRPVSLEGDCLVLEVFYKFHKDQLEQDKCRKMVEQVCGQVFSTPIKLKFILSQKPAKTVTPTPDLSEPEEDIIKIAQDIFGGDTIQ
jgi:DNA polymerase III gamma/tau subunit